LLSEVKKDGVKVVASRYGLALTKAGKFDKRTKVGRALQPLLDEEAEADE